MSLSVFLSVPCRFVSSVFDRISTATADAVQSINKLHHARTSASYSVQMLGSALLCKACFEVANNYLLTKAEILSTKPDSLSKRDAAIHRIVARLFHSLGTIAGIYAFYCLYKATTDSKFEELNQRINGVQQAIANIFETEAAAEDKWYDRYDSCMHDYRETDVKAREISCTAVTLDFICKRYKGRFTQYCTTPPLQPEEIWSFW